LNNKLTGSFLIIYILYTLSGITRLVFPNRNAMETTKKPWMLETMVRIRRFEERVRDLFADAEIPGFVHLYIGQEAVAVGACAALTGEDYITSTHRGHGHCIAKGLNVKKMMAELYGKATG